MRGAPWRGAPNVPDRRLASDSSSQSGVRWVACLKKNGWSPSDYCIAIGGPDYSIATVGPLIVAMLQ